MALEQPNPLLSYDDYAAVADDGRWYQVIDGIRHMTPSPSRRHQRIQIGLAARLHLFVEAQQLGEVYGAPFDVVLRAGRPAQVLQPDILFLARAHQDRSTPAHVQGPPDLVVEILSPSNAHLDLGRKRMLYAEYGVGELWIVPLDVDRIDVYKLGPDGHYGEPLAFEPGDRLTSPLLPGFALDVTAIFPTEDRS